MAEIKDGRDTEWVCIYCNKHITSYIDRVERSGKILCFHCWYNSYSEEERDEIDRIFKGHYA